MPLFSNKETDPNHIPAPGLPLLALDPRPASAVEMVAVALQTL